MKSKPVFLHAAAGKPWLWLGGGAYWSQSNFFSWHRRLLQELSPYVYEARQYRAELDTDSGWMYRRTGTGTILRLLGLGHFAMRGFPLAVAATVMSTVKKLSKPSTINPLRRIPLADAIEGSAEATMKMRSIRHVGTNSRS